MSENAHLAIWSGTLAFKTRNSYIACVTVCCTQRWQRQSCRAPDCIENDDDAGLGIDGDDNTTEKKRKKRKTAKPLSCGLPARSTRGQETRVSCQFAGVGINKCWHVGCLACWMTSTIYAQIYEIIPFKYTLLSILMTTRTRTHIHMYIPAIARCCRSVMRRRGGRCRLCVVPIKYAKPISDGIQLAAGNRNWFGSVHTLLPLLLILLMLLLWRLLRLRLVRRRCWCMQLLRLLRMLCVGMIFSWNHDGWGDSGRACYCNVIQCCCFAIF